METIQTKRKILIVFDDMIADMLSNKKIQSIVPELFIRYRKEMFLLFLWHSIILLNIRENSNHYFFMKISNKQELQQIAINHSCDIYFQNTAKPYLYLDIIF